MEREGQGDDDNYINLKNLKSDQENLMHKYATLLENKVTEDKPSAKKSTNVSKAFKDLKKSREINRKKM